jgi:signal transduction histidine kinase
MKTLLVNISPAPGIPGGFRMLAIAALWGYMQLAKYQFRRLKKHPVGTKSRLRTNELNNSLSELKTTQEQLIQSEKMASLGELTSGIAHEIKNPLNFVNNFSEINMELITEIEDEQIPKLDENNQAEMAPFIKTLKKNLEKINHHGKRIDGIVKGMLQHSRLGNTKKEPVDINALCDESLKLAWHGFRAKEKTFDASFETRDPIS